jgi:oligosaccharide repeat unit polymerase
MTRPGVHLLAPPVLVVFCWTLTAGMAALVLSLPDLFPLVSVFMAREDLTPEAFVPIGGLWLATCLIVYLVADFAMKQALPLGKSVRKSVNVNRVAVRCFQANMVLLGTTALWILLSAHKVGGVMNLSALVYTDSLAARDLLLQHKLFTGMRLFYAALPVTGAMAAALLVWPADPGLSRRNRRLCGLIVVINLVALLALPLVMSQRLLLLQFILSAFVSVCMARGRVVAVAYIPVGILLFLATWILREAITNPTLDQSAATVGLQKLAFYFVNDLWNSYKPISTEIEHTFGMFSLRGLLFFTLTDGYFGALMSDRMDAIEAVRGGGDFSIFTAPYVDFGPFVGIVFVALVAGCFRYAFYRGKQTLLWAVIYGQIAASLMFSTHGVYATHQNFMFSVLVAIWITGTARLRAKTPVQTRPSHA